MESAQLGCSRRRRRWLVELANLTGPTLAEVTELVLGAVLLFLDAPMPEGRS